MASIAGTLKGRLAVTLIASAGDSLVDVDLGTFRQDIELPMTSSVADSDGSTFAVALGVSTVGVRHGIVEALRHAADEIESNTPAVAATT